LELQSKTLTNNTKQGEVFVAQATNCLMPSYDKSTTFVRMEHVTMVTISVQKVTRLKKKPCVE
jgi:hypothetical protein